MRTVLSVACVGLFVAADVRTESYALTLKEWPAVGQTIAVRFNHTWALRGTRKVDGKVIPEEKRMEALEAYTQKTVKKGDPRPEIYERTYSKAQRSLKGKKETRSYQGRTVVFEQHEGPYRVVAEGKPDLAPADLSDLAREAKNGPWLALLKPLLPDKKVKLNETWAIPGKALVRPGKGANRIDPKLSGGEGKLVKVYRKDGQRFAALVVKVRLVYRTDSPFRLSPADVTYAVDLALDSPTFVGKVVMQSKSRLTVEEDKEERVTNIEASNVWEVRLGK